MCSLCIALLETVILTPHVCGFRVCQTCQTRFHIPIHSFIWLYTGGEKLGSEIRSFLSCTITSRTGPGRVCCIWQNLELERIQSSLLTPSYARTRPSLDPCSQKQLFTHLPRKVIGSIRPPSSRHSAVTLSRCCHGAVTVLSRCCHVFSACSNMLSIEAQYAHSLPSFAILAPCCSGWRSRCVCLNPGILESSSAELLSNYLSYCQPLNSKQRPPTVENPPWCQFQNIIDDIDVCIKLQLITILLWEFDKYCWSQSFCWDPRRLINRKLIYRKGRPSI